MSATALVSIVDDDESVRESLPDLLKEFGFAVQSFASAEEFLASGHVDETRCLVLDIAMPGMSGPELQRELTRRNQPLPIVFITANEDSDRMLAGNGRRCRELSHQTVQRNGFAPRRNEGNPNRVTCQR
jgi:FixJ family two-component response regulator